MDSAFWQGMQTRFLELDPEGNLHASCNPDGWDYVGETVWLLEGSPDQVSEERFKSLAALGAVALGFPDSPEAWTQWLDCLRRMGPGWIGAVWTAEADDGGDIDVVDILRLCVVSARFCESLADEHRRREIQGVLTSDNPSAHRRAAGAGKHSPATRERARVRAAKINPLLKKLGFSRLRWAERAGVNPSVAYGYMDGESMPRNENRKALAEAINCPLDEFPE
jgi:hypothetical protein